MPPLPSQYLLILGPAARFSAAQSPQAAPSTSASAASPPAQAEDPDKDFNLSQPDFTLLALPTTLRLPRYGSAFRVTHRFGRPLGQGDLGDLVSDLFGLDSGALIGLEYRFGLFRGAQVGINRTSDKNIQFFSQYNLKDQRDGFPIGVAVTASIDGSNNFKDSYSPGVGAIISRELGDRGAVYLEPFWVNNTNGLPSELVDDNNTFFLGIAARIRIRPSVYIVAEGAPRIAGDDPGVTHAGFAIEKRAGKHTFQLNVSNSFATTVAPVARGGFNSDDWYLGFNLSRKFF